MYAKIRQELADLDEQAGKTEKAGLQAFLESTSSLRSDLFAKRGQLLQKVNEEFAELMDELVRIETKAHRKAMKAADDATETVGTTKPQPDVIK